MNDEAESTPGTGSRRDIVSAVYALREAAVDHGLALANLRSDDSRQTRDVVLETRIALEERTVDAIEECGETPQDAGDGGR